jgi:energy-coupling factor transporter ATP-binding protein EcfA2
MLRRGTDMRIESIYLRGIGPFDEVTIDLPEGTDPDLADVYLLTGPNGCGKSTVLYAIASLVAKGERHISQDVLTARARTLGALAAIRGPELRRAATWQPLGAPWAGLPDPFGGPDLEEINDKTKGVPHFFGARGESAYPSAPVIDLNRDAPHLAFDWAAFAYSGMRSLADGRVDAIQAPRTSPFEGSLSFDSSADSREFAQWITNQQFMQLKALNSGHSDRAAALGRSIKDIERAITEIIGDELTFVMSDADNDVRVRRNGVVVALEVLPTGLQSIMSWIANLLMRLDRIPWVDNTPPTQRSFLLLLDEIDIHLHPAWQRKVIPVVQRLFPRAQIIASTHSPFVVASAEDAHVVHFAVENGTSQLVEVHESQRGTSYSAILKDIFGITSGFDVKTEEMFARFHEEKNRFLRGETSDRAEVERLARELAERSYEISQMIGFELRQLDRQLAQGSPGA